MANANCLSRGSVGEKKNNNELLQSLFFEGHRVVPDERLLCYPTRNIFQNYNISGRWILVPFG